MKLMLRRDLKPGDLFVYVDQVTIDDDPDLAEDTKPGELLYVSGGPEPDVRLGATESPESGCNLSEKCADSRVIRIKKGSGL